MLLSAARMDSSSALGNRATRGSAGCQLRYSGCKAEGGNATRFVAETSQLCRKNGMLFPHLRSLRNPKRREGRPWGMRSLFDHLSGSVCEPWWHYHGPIGRHRHPVATVACMLSSPTPRVHSLDTQRGFKQDLSATSLSQEADAHTESGCAQKQRRIHVAMCA